MGPKIELDLIDGERCLPLSMNIINNSLSKPQVFQEYVYTLSDFVFVCVCVCVQL